ncbi:MULTISPECIES: alpha/beta fold hydrolase [unclassified Geodermatophilus]
MSGAGTPGVEHGTAVVAPGVRIHHVVAGAAAAGGRTVVLVHGYPQSWWSWRHVIGPLAEAGHRVVAVDLRGAGGSSRPAMGYDTWTLAGDVHTVVRDHLAVDGRVAVVGHDIGSMVALAHGLRFRGDADRLVLMEATLPGTQVHEQLASDPRHWHYAFHATPDLPEFLTAGREREYLRFFFDGAAHDPCAITADDLDRYAADFRQPGAMRAGFELYRAFVQDDRDNRAALAAAGRLTVPVLAVAGEANLFAEVDEAMAREVADDVRAVTVPRAGHWVPEENPSGLLEVLLPFLEVSG